MRERSRLLLGGAFATVVAGAVAVATWSSPGTRTSAPGGDGGDGGAGGAGGAGSDAATGEADAGEARRAMPPQPSAQSSGDDAGDGADGGAPLFVMEPAVLAAPWDHFGRTARYEGMRDGALVGKVSVLVGCRKVRILGDGEPRDIALTLPRPDGGADRSCLNVAGSDETRLFFFAGMRLYAFDVAAGAVAWSVDHEPDDHVGQDDTSAVAIAGSIIAVASARGRVEAFDRATGAPAWTLDAAAGTDASKLGKTRLVAAGTRLVTMRRAARPQPIGGADGGWEITTRYATARTPEETRAALVTADRVRSVEAATGRVVWTSALAMADGAAALGLELAANETEVAVVTTSTRSSSAPFEILLLDAATAGLRANAPITSPLSEYGDVLDLDLTCTDGGGLYLRRTTKLARIDEATGAFRWEIDDAATRPVLARGALFVPGAQAVLHALDPATGAAVWSYGFAALRVPMAPGSRALGPPRKLAVAASDGGGGGGSGGGEMVAAFATAYGDGVNRSGEASLFAPVSVKVARHEATLEANVFDEQGKPQTDTEQTYRLLARSLTIPADTELRLRVRGNGALAIEAHPMGAGIDLLDKVVDLDQGKADYRLNFRWIWVGQGCQ